MMQPGKNEVNRLIEKARRDEIDDLRAKLTAAEAAIERVKALADNWERDGGNRPDLLRRHAKTVRRALQGELP